MSRLGTFSGARAGLGLLLGTAAGIGVLCALYSQRWRRTQRRGQRLSLPNSLDYTQTAEPGHHVRPLRAVPGEAGDAVVLPSLPGEGQEEVLARLDFVLTSLVALRQEVEELRSSLQALAGDIVEGVRSHMEENQRATRRRRFPFTRERSDSTGSSSVYFTAASGATFTDAESEGGYTTANAESDYERDSDRESEDGEDEVSCETVKMGRKDSLDLEVEVLGLAPAPEAEDSPGLEDVLPLLQQVDELHQGSEQDKREGFQLLLNKKLVVRPGLPICFSCPLPTRKADSCADPPCTVPWEGSMEAGRTSSGAWHGPTVTCVSSVRRRVRSSSMPRMEKNQRRPHCRRETRMLTFTSGTRCFVVSWLSMRASRSASRVALASRSMWTKPLLSSQETP
ncbi:regulator of microtubule dynamics protein 3 isoform X2 [Erinaceus europaeus]|uniref:Regulator of microtubule dynamics protein 3 isoform X2 n=1 Tax=Erinaceus europaeus TaxID=9365 RepID=A0ABM3W3F5_ERIEU|nr:regulator of microtubule dynamics protein 3 isoform X2 [Erinaceus europaeus]